MTTNQTRNKRRLKLDSRTWKNSALALFPLLALAGGAFAKEVPATPVITVFAAAGTRPATEEICDRFEKQAAVKVERNYTSSGTLARQIASGAECDVFISANQEWITFLADKQLLVKNSVRVIGGNRLTMIASKNSPLKPPFFSPDFDIAAYTPDRAAIGDPASVPVGKYTLQVFDALKWKDRIQSKLIAAQDVSAVLHYVEIGECDWGVVYYTEAIQSAKVKILATLPAKLHEPIVFYVADIAGQKEAGRALSASFVEAPGQAIMTSHGFTPAADPGAGLETK